MSQMSHSDKYLVVNDIEFHLYTNPLLSEREITKLVCSKIDTNLKCGYLKKKNTLLI